jgi:hypothetical protein
MTRKAKATIGDRYGVPDKGKTEIVHGELIRMAPTSRKSNGFLVPFCGTM